MEHVAIDIKRMHQIENARLMRDLIGARAAANYLRQLGWSVEAALYILLDISE